MPLRIVCTISTMQLGGAQHVMAQLCAHLAARGHEVHLVTLEPANTPSFIAPPAGVHVVPLGRASEAASGLGRAWRVACWVRELRRSLIEFKPNVIISFLDMMNVMTLAATWGRNFPVIVSERIDPHHHPLGRVEARMRQLTYPRADRIVVQTARAARFFHAYPPSKLAVIANPVAAAASAASPGRADAGGRWRIVGLGRYNRQKGFDILIDAFRRLAPEFPDWGLAIFGEGPEAQALKSAQAEANLGSRLQILPATKDVAGELARSHIFAFPSRFEGFPNALTEAMAAGLPCVAFPDVSGVEDLIVDDSNGVLANSRPDDAAAAIAFAEALRRLMQSPGVRGRLGAAAQASIGAYAPARIWAQWDELIEDVLEKRRHLSSS